MTEPLMTFLVILGILLFFGIALAYMIKHPHKAGKEKLGTGTLMGFEQVFSPTQYETRQAVEEKKQQEAPAPDSEKKSPLED
jgi:hypothetical protein